MLHGLSRGLSLYRYPALRRNRAWQRAWYGKVLLPRGRYAERLACRDRRRVAGCDKRTVPLSHPPGLPLRFAYNPKTLHFIRFCALKSLHFIDYSCSSSALRSARIPTSASFAAVPWQINGIRDTGGHFFRHGRMVYSRVLTQCSPINPAA